MDASISVFSDSSLLQFLQALNLHPFQDIHWASWQRTEAASGSLTNTCVTELNQDIVLKLDLFHCMLRFSWEGVSEHQPLHSTSCKFLSAASTTVELGVPADAERGLCLLWDCAGSTLGRIL